MVCQQDNPSKVAKAEHPENILFILVTLSIFQLDNPFKDDNEEHPENM